MSQARLSHLSNVQAEDRDSRTFPSSRNLSDCQRESIVNELYHSKYRKHQQTERPFIAHLLSAQQQYNVVRLTRGMHMLLPDQQRHFRRQQRILHFYCALVERRIQRFVFRPKVEEVLPRVLPCPGAALSALTVLCTPVSAIPAVAHDVMCAFESRCMRLVGESCGWLHVCVEVEGVAEVCRGV